MVYRLLNYPSYVNNTTGVNPLIIFARSQTFNSCLLSSYHNCVFPVPGRPSTSVSEPNCTPPFPRIWSKFWLNVGMDGKQVSF